MPPLDFWRRGFVDASPGVLVTLDAIPGLYDYFDGTAGLVDDGAGRASSWTGVYNGKTMAQSTGSKRPLITGSGPDFDSVRTDQMDFSETSDSILGSKPFLFCARATVEATKWLSCGQPPGVPRLYFGTNTFAYNSTIQSFTNITGSVVMSWYHDGSDIVARQNGTEVKRFAIALSSLLPTLTVGAAGSQFTDAVVHGVAIYDATTWGARFASYVEQVEGLV